MSQRLNGSSNALTGDVIRMLGIGCFCLLLSGAALRAQGVPQNGQISTIAGNGSAAPSGNGGPATSAGMYPTGVAVDSMGNFYIADQNYAVVQEVTAATGIITTVAGNGTSGCTGDGGPATSAALMQAIQVAVDGAGNIYIADPACHVIRKVTKSTGIITTVAGNGTYGWSGDGGPATSAAIDADGVAVDGSANMYIAGYGANVVRKVTTSTGVISTVAGNGAAGFSGDGGPATGAALAGAIGVAVDGNGNLYIATYADSRIRKVTASTGIITTVAGNGSAGFSGDGGPATSAALDEPEGVAVDSVGDILIADALNNRIRLVTASTGVISTFAGNGTAGFSGDGGPATSAELNAPAEVALDRSGNIYIADQFNNRIRAVGASQTVTGVEQGGLVLPGNTWNEHPFGIMDYTTGIFRYYWSCGNPNGICVGHATSQTFFDGEPISINNATYVCDIQDPGIVKFNGLFYLYAGGIAPGAPPNAGCNNEQGAGNEHAAIYAFVSSDGVSFAALSSNPVIKVPGDPCYTCYTGHGINGPSPVVMGSGSFIRVYYWIQAPGYGLVGGFGIEAQDSYDGVTFSNERAIMPSAYWESVKRVGLYGDYPMVMTYATSSGAMTATSSSSSDTSWTVGNNGAPISTNPGYSYPPRLESDDTGLFLNANGSAFTSPVSGQTNFDWDDGVVLLFGSTIFRGLANAAQFFNF